VAVEYNGNSQKMVVCKVCPPPSRGQRQCDFYREVLIFVRVVHPAIVSFRHLLMIHAGKVRHDVTPVAV
jgi:hypothetical protein